MGRQPKIHNGNINLENFKAVGVKANKTQYLDVIKFITSSINFFLRLKSDCKLSFVLTRYLFYLCAIINKKLRGNTIIMNWQTLDIFTNKGTAVRCGISGARSTCCHLRAFAGFMFKVRSIRSWCLFCRRIGNFPNKG